MIRDGALLLQGGKVLEMGPSRRLENLTVARGFKPLSDDEMNALRKRCAAAAADGRFELYKMSLKYDNPETRRPHGFPLDPKEREVQEMFKEAGVGQE